MRSIGFDDAAIGGGIAIYSVVMLIAETPSGILADRWSRKGVLMLASIALSVGALIGGVSHSEVVYLVSVLLWAIFTALNSGTYDSIVYDTVLETTGSSKLFERMYGRVKLIDSTASVLGSILGGLIASQFGLRAAFFLTIPSALLSIIALMVFREPTLHKSEIAVPVVKHIRSTFAAILKNKDIATVVIVLTLTSALLSMLFWFNQVWLLAIAAPIVLYGPANALLLTSSGIGGTMADYFKIYRYQVMVATILVMLGSATGLVFSRSVLVIVVCQTLLGTALVGIGIVFSRMLHDSLHSRVRASAASAVATLTHLCVIPLSLIFGLVSRKTSIFSASWILVAIVIVSAVFILIESSKNNHTGLHPKPES